MKQGYNSSKFHKYLIYWYNKKIRESLIIDYNLNKIQLPIDSYLFLNYRCYIYNEPLCYQLFPETENKKNWHLIPDGSSNLFSTVGAIIVKKYVELYGLDKNVEPGYSILYKISLIITYLLILILLMILFIIMYYVYKLHLFSFKIPIYRAKKKNA